MRILAAGGGSGGHVTPVVAVLRELKARNSKVELRFWCDRKFAPQARQVIHSFDSNMPVEVVFSGKLRRYHNVSVLRQLTYPPIVFRNIRDMFLVAMGFIQSLFKLIIWRPDIVFTKGGYVCLPIGLAAWLLRIPLVIHDSDAHPGLTNRILSRFATKIATGAPLKYYSYPKSRSYYVGIPIGDKFRPFSEIERRQAKESLGFSSELPLIAVTGGGLGARRINDSIVASYKDITTVGSLLLLSGKDQYEELRDKLPDNSDRFRLHSFVPVDTMATILGAADIVVARAGATTILELAALEKPTILIPNNLLTGGHQIKNAAVYAESGAVVLVDEDDLVKNPNLLYTQIASILSDESKMRSMSRAFGNFAKPEAASDMADIILSAAKQ